MPLGNAVPLREKALFCFLQMGAKRLSIKHVCGQYTPLLTQSVHFFPLIQLLTIIPWIEQSGSMPAMRGASRTGKRPSTFPWFLLSNVSPAACAHPPNPLTRCLVLLDSVWTASCRGGSWGSLGSVANLMDWPLKGSAKGDEGGDHRCPHDPISSLQ